MTTYDYYKDGTSRTLYYNQYLSVTKVDGQTEVTVEASDRSTPFICQKGIWYVFRRGAEFIPEGDPQIDENGVKKYNSVKPDYKMVWGRVEKNV